MKTALIQFCPSRDARDNAGRVRELAPEGADLILLPELSDHGYFVSRDFLSGADLDAFPEAMKELSLKLGSTVIFGAAEKEEGAFYDSLFVSDRGKLVGKYRKMHLTDHEKEVFSPGDSPLVFTLGNGIRIAPAICFDLWFPEFFRAGRKEGADIFVAAGAFGGTASLMMAGARAAENSVPLILANRAGSEMFEGARETFCGSSRVISHSGELLASLGSGCDEVLLLDVDAGRKAGNVICRDMDAEISRHP